MKVNLPFLAQDSDRHGNVRLYARRAGVGKVRLRSLPESREFMDEYRAALVELDRKAAQPAKDDVGTLGWLVREFEGSHGFRTLAERERRVRHLQVRAMLDTETKPGSGLFFRDCPLKHFGADNVRFLRDKKSESPSIANRRLSHLRIIFGWGVEERGQHVKRNPALGVKGLGYDKQPFHTWSEDEVAKFEQRHPVGTMARLAIDLILYTGARRSDVVDFGHRMLRQIVNPETGEPETWLVFTPGKTKKSTRKEIWLPLLDVLRDSLAATAHGIETFLITTHGKRHASGDSFANWFKDRVVEAELPGHCSPHGLRKVGAVRAAENGATERQMMALFGWDTPKLAAHYARMASQKKLAAASVHTLIGKVRSTVPLS
jgi:integrase